MNTPLFSSALLVEDEPNLAIALGVALQKLNIPNTFHAANLTDAKQYLHSHPKPDFILLDRTLPDGDGIELCASLRNENYSGTILILTASGEIFHRVQGLNSGADDYLPKPFSWEELEARIRALARRQSSHRTPTPVSPHPTLWKLDESQLRILGPKGWVELTPLEFKLAACLIQMEGTIVSRNGLLKEVWGFTLLPKTRTVDHFLGRLRKYFEVNPEEPRHFLTIRGAGYKFVV